jgi:hypothetical protein
MVDTDKKPDFINEQGVKWWFDAITTDYAKCRNLPNHKVWLVEELNGSRIYVITEGDKIVGESQQLEAIGVKLDVLGFLAKEDKDHV